MSTQSEHGLYEIRKLKQRLWFWVAYASVSDRQAGVPPCSGSTTTRAEAWRAVCTATDARAKLVVPEYVRGLCNDVLGTGAVPLPPHGYAIGSLGKDRWVWVVWDKNEHGYIQQDAREYGYAPTHAEAQHAALAVTGSGATQYPAGYATKYHHRLVVERRMHERSSATDTAPREFVYEGRPWSGGPGELPYSKYRVVKKTAKRIYVERVRWHDAPRQQLGDWRDHDVKTFILDREVFERTGKARSGYTTYYASSADALRNEGARHTPPPASLPLA